MRTAVRFSVVFLICCFASGIFVMAQSTTGALHGQVTDPSGAVVMGAKVTVTGSGETMTVVTNGKGMYEIKALAAGSYSVRVAAKGFANFETQGVTIAAGAAQSLDIPLSIAVETQRVKVEDESTSVSTDASSNASTVVIKGKDLDALSDDPDELQSDLEALAGPSAGPNGGQIYIDGFSDGTLPPKSAIREIRVNQNPFSAQYDRVGFGRVEVFTKPGQDTYHGQLQVMGGDSVFNSLNPFLQAGTFVPNYYRNMLMGSIGGPINKKASFFFNFHRGDFNDVSIVNATLPCADFLTSGTCSAYDPRRDTAAVPRPHMHSELSPRIDYQLSPNNTLTARYEYETSSNTNGGVGQFNLPSQAYNSTGYEHNFRITDTQVINSTTINETRLQFVREHNEQNALFQSPQIAVGDMFTSGGNASGNSRDDQNRFEFQNYTSKMHGKHFTRFGGRVRVRTNDNYALQNPYGSFVYQSGDSFVAGTPMQFTITQGNPWASVSQTDAGLYAEDDWRVKPNLTVSYGLRFETQNNVPNRANLAPRLGVAWGLGGGAAPKTVLRAGFGMFYDRFSSDNVLQIDRTNGLDPQIKYSVESPGFTTVPSDPATLAALLTGSNAPRIVYSLGSRFKVPYTMQVALTLERQVSKDVKMSASYIASRGLHQLSMENVETSGLQNYLYESNGTFKQHQFMVNGTVRAGQFVSLFGWYVLSYANSNTDGGFPSAQGQLAADWGRASFDVRNRGMVGGSVNLPYGFRLSPFITASSGKPFNITTGTDPVYNPRPYFSRDCSAAGLAIGESHFDETTKNTLYNTSLGCFYTAPTGLAMVPVNYAEGPGFFATNLRLSKTFGLGKKTERSAGSGGGPGGGHQHGPGMPGGLNIRSIMEGSGPGTRYSLTFGVSARNLFNTVNKDVPAGNLSSANFGKSVAIAPFGWGAGSMNREVMLSANFNF
jgi:Carboxypeptidase regulatory-like domain/TonB dependent receptor-like, beta-barrel